MTNGSSGYVYNSLKEEAALCVNVDHLTTNSTETLRDLDVHCQLQAERIMIDNFIDQTVSFFTGSLMLPIIALC